MGSEEIKFEEAKYGDVMVLRPEGRLDQESSEVFQIQLLSLITEKTAPQANLILDLSGVNYVSSVGLRALMIVAKQCSASDGQLALTNLSAVVLEIFEISRFNLIIDVYEDVETALGTISQDALAAYKSENA